ncbi:uncharacterized protein LTR77_003251 [Saxophila tyrrhenica]|uniref:Complex 1 LYR protein n=1 Tax=Saxophila tyrrhenica TaxID=1690608 RepID=A0AAV9PGV3_9PEZI|nr:hypothetical protein LTR77_003251 [Saxophila tyrrhenica]
MSRQQISNHYTRLLRLWPTDRLRPAERHFQRLLEHRIQHPPAHAGVEAKEVNAAYLLLDNAASRQFPLSDRIMKPRSDPQHYETLEREIDEVPDRTFWGRMMKRLGGMVRMK